MVTVGEAAAIEFGNLSGKFSEVCRSNSSRLGYDVGASFSEATGHGTGKRVVLHQVFSQEKNNFFIILDNVGIQ